MSQSTNSRKAGRWVQIPLGILLLVLALNALGGGYYGMAGAKDIPREWLKGSPFRDYFIPGLILLIFVGGSALVAAILVFIKTGWQKKRHSGHVRLWSFGYLYR